MKLIEWITRGWFGAGISNDAPEPWQLGFQDSATPTMEGITELHDSILFYLIVILVLISWMVTSLVWRVGAIASKYHNHGSLIELIWTITPPLVLIAIAFPSFKLLYLMDELIDPAMTIKVTGRQWYWEYQYSDYSDISSISFESYMIPEEELQVGELRLLEVDNRVVVPVDTQIRFIVTGGDVIHSWGIPSLGIKMDGIPGRLNQTSAFIEREGVYYGQCSELCGVWHGFMPIVVEAVSLEKYLVWVKEQLSNSPIDWSN